MRKKANVYAVKMRVEKIIVDRKRIVSSLEA